ncbi:MAG TPA: hypothetical protein VJX29_15450 [Candidatus Acidoferrales bacterium]|nr:hypothetical protein [Candidatus Acidoferrales bacterium]
MTTLLAHPFFPIFGAASALLLAAAALWWWRRRPRDPEEVERRRREYLSRVGRIVEGEILEILESPAHPSGESRGKRRAKRAPASNGNGKRSLVCYTYAISGVTYETAQDVTGFEERACLNQLIMGQPASVKYDPQSPGNSMLIAEDWNGLH